MPQNHWPKYKSHKIVQAAVIEAINYVDGRVVDLLVRPEPHASLESFMPTQNGIENLIAVGDYAIVYDNGYHSVSPKAEFDSGYALVPGL